MTTSYLVQLGFPWAPGKPPSLRVYTFLVYSFLRQLWGGPQGEGSLGEMHRMSQVGHHPQGP